MRLLILMAFLFAVSACGDDLQKRTQAPLIITENPNGSDASNDTADDSDCVPTSSCAGQGAMCGEFFDGCKTRNCGSCASGSECVDSKCVVEERLGTACESPADCAGMGCLEPSGGWRDGYCTSECTDDSTCGPNGACALETRGKRLCALLCDVDQDCGRDGYACIPAMDGTKICQAAAIGNGSVGDACESAQDCSLEGGFCVLEPSFADGYCSKTCTTNAECDADSHCATGFCFANACTRPGYIEKDLDRDARLECVPVGGQGEGLVGDACTTGADCGGGDFGGCLGQWPGGYCAIDCRAGEGTCGADSICYAFSPTSSQCLKVCTAAADCRDGYACLALPGGKSACGHTK
jgi:hypothetical protein